MVINNFTPICFLILADQLFYRSGMNKTDNGLRCTQNDDVQLSTIRGFLYASLANVPIRRGVPRVPLNYLG